MTLLGDPTRGFALIAHDRRATLVDSRGGEPQHVPLEADLVQLPGNPEDASRTQVEAGLEIIRRHRPRLQSLTDLTPEQLEPHREDLEEVVYRRCRHVVTESRRAIEAARALAAGDLAQVGRILAASHASLRDDYEVSTPELDALVERAAAIPGVYGARLGVALVERGRGPDIAEQLST